MIPNVGNTSSYLRVLICDLTRTILTEFENIVRQRNQQRISALGESFFAPHE
jgi:hypothetical protein